MKNPAPSQRSRGRRKRSLLSAAMESKLLSYTAAASAAGVGVMALSGPVEARVVYTPVEIKLSNSCYYLLLNNEGIPNFIISNRFYFTTGGQSSLAVKAIGNNSFVETSATYFGWPNAAAPLPAGAIIPASSHGAKNTGLLVAFVVRGIGGNWYEGKWAKEKNRYLGLEFQVNGKTHYGWARLSVKSLASGVLTGYAYETIPNKPIIAGKTKGPDVITVQDPSLGHLARGASAIPAWRGASGKK